MNIFKKRIETLAIMTLLFLAIFQIPEFFPTFDSHDLGSQAAIDYWTLHGFLFGKDIIQNVGPTGFLNYPVTYAGFFDQTKLILNILLTAYFIFLLVTATSNLSIAKKIVFLTIAAVFTAIIDTMLYFMLFLLLQRLFFTIKWQNLLLPVLTLALLSLAKGTCFFIVLSIIITSALSHLFYKRWLTAFFITTFFCFCVLVFWFSFGQTSSNFIDFVYAMLLFSSGYNEAMTLYESNFIRFLGVITLLGSGLAILLNSLKHCYINANRAKSIKQVLLALVESFILFIVWKHGYVRADGHIMLFLQYAMLSTLWIIFTGKSVDLESNKKDSYALPNKLIALLVSTASLIGLNTVYNFTHIDQLIRGTYKRMEKNFFAVLDIDRYRQSLRNELKKNIAEMQLPQTKKLVKDKSISYFGISPASIFYNKLKYVPTPATISFASWNSWIMNTEAKFFADDKRAPAYLLFNLQTINNRLVAQDDSLAQLEILHRYVPIGSEAGNLILQRINNTKPLTMEPILKKNYKIGQCVNVPENANPTAPIWIKVNLELPLLSKLMALMYKPPFYSIDFLLEDGSIQKFKFISRMAATGFLLNPLIIKNTDVLTAHFEPKDLKLAQDSILNKVVKMRINCDVLTFFCAQSASLQFKTINNLIAENNLTSKQYLTSLDNVKNHYDSVIDKSNIQKITVAEQCIGAIDEVNNIPISSSFAADKLFKVQGWLAKSIEPKAELPGSVLLVLTDSKGKNTFIKTRLMPRPDVGEHFQKKLLGASGYISITDVSGLEGNYTLGLAYAEGDSIKICPQFKIPGIFRFDSPLNDVGDRQVSMAERCEGFIDEINDRPGSEPFSTNKILKIRGWLAKSVEQKGEIPESVLLVLSDSAGKNIFIKTRQTTRPDVGQHFKKPLLDGSGYTSIVDVSKIDGDYTLGLAYTEGNLIKICPQFKIPGKFESGLRCSA